MELCLSYFLNPADQQRAMLAQVGADSISDLFTSIPAALRMKRPLNVPPALAEMELTQHMQELAACNRAAGDAVCFLGGGSYRPFLSPRVGSCAGRGGYYTAFTTPHSQAR